MVTAAIAIGITNWCVNSIGILVFLLIFITAMKSSRELRDISLVLTFNTCLAALLTCLTAWIMTCSNLTTGFLAYNHTFCCIWGLLYDIFACSIYHSYYLQAIYRLCRVVFYKNKALVSYTLYIKLIFGQWFFTITVLLPPILLNRYTQIPTKTYCLVPYTDLITEMYHIVILYFIPLVCIAIIYIWITTFIRNSSRVSLHALATQQRQRNLRDLTILKRIIMLMLILFTLRFPTVIFMIYAVTTGHLYPLTFDIVGLITSVCLILIGFIIIHITPQLQKKFFMFYHRRNNQINVRVIPQPEPMNNQPKGVQ